MKPLDQDNHEPEEFASPRQLKIFALTSVAPIYLLIAGLVALFGGGAAWVKSMNPFNWFAGSCALGLALTVLSFHFRVRLAHRLEPGEDGSDNTKALILGLGLAEAPALLGLLHFILFRDWTGLILLLLATLMGFMFHGLDLGFGKLESFEQE